LCKITEYNLGAKPEGGHWGAVLQA